MNFLLKLMAVIYFSVAREFKQATVIASSKSGRQAKVNGVLLTHYSYNLYPDQLKNHYDKPYVLPMGIVVLIILDYQYSVRPFLIS